MTRRDARARLELENAKSLRGPLRWIALGCFMTFVIGVIIFFNVCSLKAGDPAPAPGEELPQSSEP